MPLRESPYIDFNTGTVKVLPMELIRALGPRANQSIDQMLMIFECRVDVWQFGPAVAMLRLMEAPREETSVWAHSGYTLLGASFNYFEMVGKILNPASNAWRSSKSDFNHGFCDVYPAFAISGPNRRDAKLKDVAEFRDRVRNGMYHLGYTKSHLWIHHAPDKWPDDFMVVHEGGERHYLVNPHNLTRTLVAHFPSLLGRLRDPAAEFDRLREKFLEFYIDFHAKRDVKVALS